MNEKIKELLENAEQSDAIARNKWRIENREQLRKERKEKLKELMEKDKQQTAVEWFANQLNKVVSNTADASTHNHKELLEQAKEMEIAGKEMSYSDGYSEGYKRALEFIQYHIETKLKIQGEEKQ